MRDPEFVELRNKFLIGILIAVVFTVPLFIYVYKTFSNPKVLTKIDKGETFSLVIVSKDCEKCGLVEDILDSKNIKYLEVNSSTDKNYKSIINKLGIKNTQNSFPVIVYVKDGKMAGNMMNINSENEVLGFLEFHKIINS